MGNKEYLKGLGRAIKFCCDELKIERPVVKIVKDSSFTEQNSSYAGYVPSSKEVTVVIYKRTLADTMRSLCHEIYHHNQNIAGRLTSEAGADGDQFENEANAFAGKMMRELGRKYPESFFMTYE